MLWLLHTSFKEKSVNQPIVFVKDRESRYSYTLIPFVVCISKHLKISDTFKIGYMLKKGENHNVTKEYLYLPVEIKYRTRSTPL